MHPKQRDTDRYQRRTRRLVAAYHPAVTPATAAALQEHLAAGAYKDVVRALAGALVHEGVELQSGDAVELRWLLATVTAAPAALRDLLLLNGPPSDGYMFYLYEGPAPEVVAAAAVAAFGVPPEAIGIVRDDRYTGSEEPVVYLEAVTGSSRVAVSAGRDFVDLVDGASGLAVATAWCGRLGRRVMLSAFGLTEDEWVLGDL